MIKIYLSRILGEKRITQAELARQTGIRPSTISDIYNEMTERLNIEYIPNKQKKTEKFLIKEHHGNRKK